MPEVEVRRWVKYSVIPLGSCPICGKEWVGIEVSVGDDAVGEYGSYLAVAFCKECTGPYQILSLTAIALSYRGTCSLSEALDWLLAKKLIDAKLERELRDYIERLARRGESVEIPPF